MIHYYYGIILLLLVASNVVVTTNAENCVSALKQIYMAEEALQQQQQQETQVARNYVLCSDTIFTPGTVNPDNGIILEGQDAPLVCRSNCTIECQSENCVIDGAGGGTYGIFLMPSLVFNDDTSTMIEDIVIRGVTVRNWRNSAANQIPVVVGGTSGSVTFEDCTFEYNQADPLFLLDHHVVETEGRRRRQLITTDGNNRPPFQKKDKGGLMLPTPVQLLSFHGDEDRNDNNNNNDEKAPLLLEHNTRRRHLEDASSSNLFIKFDSCVFQHNLAPEDAQTRGGYSLVRFRGTNPENPEDLVSNALDAAFISCDFLNNTFVLPENEYASLSLIDFYSTGLLTLDKNCFLDSNTVQKEGIVTMQSGAQLLELSNFKEEKEEFDRSCNFVATLDSTYGSTGECFESSLGDSCRPFQLVPCFSVYTTVETLDQGTVAMKDLKLGDRIKVSDNKYEPIYSFGHFDTTKVTTQFLQIQTTKTQQSSSSADGGSFLEMTPNHFVFVRKGKAVPASSLAVGDSVLLASGETDQVTALKTMTRTGIIAPFTPSGTLVTGNGGIVSSSFANLDGSTSPYIQLLGHRRDNDDVVIELPITYHQLGLWFESPHRLYCHLFGCTSETYTADDGMSHWVATPLRVYQWVLQQQQQQHVVMSGILLGMGLLLLMVVNFVELLLVVVGVVPFGFFVVVVVAGLWCGTMLIGHYAGRFGSSGRAKKLV